MSAPPTMAHRIQIESNPGGYPVVVVE